MTTNAFEPTEPLASRVVVSEDELTVQGGIDLIQGPLNILSLLRARVKMALPLVKISISW